MVGVVLVLLLELESARSECPEDGRPMKASGMPSIGPMTPRTTSTSRQIWTEVQKDSFSELLRFTNNLILSLVDEEFDSNDDSNSRPSTCPYRVGGGHSMTSTNFTSGTALTTTTNEDDGAQLIKPKKKKGLFKNLFHFGSRKGRSKSASSEPSRGEGGGGGSPSNRHSHNDSNTSEEVFRSPDLMRNRQYLVEQERINAQYRKLMEAKQRQQQQQQQQQPPQFVRNQLHPMHQSMPIGQRSRSSPSKQQMMMMEQPLIGSPPTGNANGYAGVHAGSFVPNYGSHPRHSKQRDQTMGVPAIGGQQQQFGSLNIHKKSNESNSKMNAYMMRHRVHPEQIKFGPEGAAHSFGDANAQVRSSELKIFGELMI